MKIQHLEIFNIASIEKAYIDFEKAPLRDSDVFLITGKIGAGKSTILDAICLALYGTTPRINKGKRRCVEVNNDNLSNDDPRQMMRRNTGEAYVKLAFVGTDGNEYEAEWHVQRGKLKKAESALDSDVWNVKNLTTGEFLSGSTSVEKKSKEVREAIEKAVGLDFDQFCRTTMLAQGEFTRFLNSDENDKAAILEKITGTEIYSRLGLAIYNINKEKHAAFKALSEKLGDIQLLSQDEIEEKNQRLTEIASESLAKKAEQDALQIQKNWLETLMQLKENVESARLRMEEAKEAMLHPEYQDAVQLVAQWQETIEVRHDLGEVNESAKTMEEVERRFDGPLQKQYIQALMGWQFIQSQQQDNESERGRLATVLEAQDDKKAVFENDSEIIASLREKVTLQRNIETAKGEKKTYEDQLEGLKLALADKEKAFGEADQACKEMEVEVGKDEKHLGEMLLPELRERHEKHIRSIGDIGALLLRLQHLKKESEEIGALKKHNSEMESEINALATKIEEEREALKREEELLKALEQIVVLSQQSVNQWTKQLRASLKEGCKCPVCQQTLKEELPLEDELEQTYRDNNKKYEAQKATVETLRKTFDEHQANFWALKLQLAENQARYAQRLEALKKDELGLVEDGSTFGVQSIDSAEQQLNQAKQNQEAEDKTLQTKIHEAEQFETALNAKRKKQRQLENDKSLAFNEKTKASMALDNCKEAIVRCEKAIEGYQKEMVQLDENLAHSLDGIVWPNDWRNDTVAFGKYFKDASKQYNTDKTRLEDLQRKINATDAVLTEIGVMQQKITEKVPAWKLLGTAEKAEMPDLKTAWLSLNDEVLRCCEQLNQAKAKGEKARQKVGVFLQEHPEMDMPRLLALSQCSQSAFEEQKAFVEAKSNAMTATKVAWETLTRQLDEHNAKKPEGLTPEMTIETLTSDINSIGEVMLQLENERTLIAKNINDDNQLRTNYLSLKQKAQQSGEECAKWERLNKWFGDANGITFKKIAQSFILGGLLNSANGYLKSLHPRYTLKVVPGTLYIALEDAYQGFATRSTATLSGGESFLVSLSLALALSDIGQNLAVDTLFIDEGFGTLSGNELTNAITTLRDLHRNTGRHVGIISHVEAVKEKIPVQIMVTQEGLSSSSTIKVEPSEES